MAVRRIDDDDVDAGADQRFDALVGVAAGAHGSADAQAAELVLARVRMLDALEDVLHRDEAAKLHVAVDDEHALEAVAMHEALGDLDVRAFGHRHEAIALGHDVRHRLVEVRLEAQVAVGHDADDAMPLDDRKSRDAVPLRQCHHLAHRHRRRDGDGVLDHAALEALHLGDLGRLPRRRHVLVHYADAAFLRDRDGEPRLGDRVHGGRHERDVERDAAGEARLERDVARYDEGVRGN